MSHPLFRFLNLGADALMNNFFDALITSALARGDILGNITLLILATFFARAILIQMGQLWVSNISSSLSFYLLPLITYSITSVISGNIALSLGLVGALSIVRFRNPVKSSLELTMYFLLIGFGITASADFRWTLVLMVSVLLTLFVTYLSIEFFRRVFGRELFIASFNEANALNVLEIIADKKVTGLDKSDFLMGLSKDSSGYIYRLASSEKKELIRIIEFYEDNKSVHSFNFNAV